MKKLIGVWFVLLLLTAGLFSFWLANRQRERLAAENVAQADPAILRKPEDWLKQYTLTDQTGQPFGTKDLQGQVHVVSFFFATCPSTCRMQNQKVQMLADEFGDQGVKFVSITVDPEKDTSVALNAYSQMFNADPQQWKFLTGEMPYIKRVGAEIYQSLVDQQTHSERLLIVDRWGDVRARYHWGKPEDLQKTKELITELLAEKEPPAEQSETPEATAQVSYDEETGRIISAGDSL